MSTAKVLLAIWVTVFVILFPWMGRLTGDMKGWNKIALWQQVAFTAAMAFLMPVAAYVALLGFAALWGWALA